MKEKRAKEILKAVFETGYDAAIGDVIDKCRDLIQDSSDKWVKKASKNVVENYMMEEFLEEMTEPHYHNDGI